MTFPETRITTLQKPAINKFPVFKTVFLPNNGSKAGIFFTPDKENFFCNFQ